jgi:thiol-disulfide isomerase/thioredoxin
MTRAIAACVLTAVLAAATAPALAQQDAEADVVSSVQAAIALARGALAANQVDKANQYAVNACELAASAFKDPARGNDPHVRVAFEAALENRASVMVEQGARSEAVYFLLAELETYRDTSIHDQIQGIVDRVSLEGRPAPRLATRLHVGPRVPSVEQLKGSVVLLFFWAHWCPECKAESPTIARLRDKYRSRGLVIVAPTQRYGYVDGGRPAAPDKELRHIIDVRNAHYSFLRDEPVPISAANYREYGVTSIPMHVLLDRQGVVRLYRPGRMFEDELEAAIRKLL